MKFRPHSIAVARTENDINARLASERAERGTPAWHAEYVILWLEGALSHGLMNCYKSFKDAMPDLYLDFPPDEAAFLKTIKLILGDKRYFDIALGIDNHYEFDLTGELLRASEPHS